MNLLGTLQDFIRCGVLTFLLCRRLLDSLSGRCAVVEKIVLCAFCAVGVAFMIYVLVGTQRALNRQKRAKMQGQEPTSRLRWK
jgi:hypothetical protein